MKKVILLTLMLCFLSAPAIAQNNEAEEAAMELETENEVPCTETVTVWMWQTTYVLGIPVPYYGPMDVTVGCS